MSAATVTDDTTVAAGPPEIPRPGARVVLLAKPTGSGQNAYT
jgi:hypothetical protein